MSAWPLANSRYSTDGSAMPASMNATCRRYNPRCSSETLISVMMVVSCETAAQPVSSQAPGPNVSASRLNGGPGTTAVVGQYRCSQLFVQNSARMAPNGSKNSPRTRHDSGAWRRYSRAKIRMVESTAAAPTSHRSARASFSGSVAATRLQACQKDHHTQAISVIASAMAPGRCRCDHTRRAATAEMALPTSSPAKYGPALQSSKGTDRP